MARPYWSGQIQISLVSFGVSLFPATEAASQITFHQIDRRTGERIRHQNVAQDQESVDRADIVKGYEVRKGERNARQASIPLQDCSGPIYFRSGVRFASFGADRLI